MKFRFLNLILILFGFAAPAAAQELLSIKCESLISAPDLFNSKQRDLFLKEIDRLMTTLTRVNAGLIKLPLLQKQMISQLEVMLDKVDLSLPNLPVQLKNIQNYYNLPHEINTLGTTLTAIQKLQSEARLQIEFAKSNELTLEQNIHLALNVATVREICQRIGFVTGDLVRFDNEVNTSFEFARHDILAHQVPGPVNDITMKKYAEFRFYFLNHILIQKMNDNQKASVSWALFDAIHEQFNFLPVLLKYFERSDKRTSVIYETNPNRLLSVIREFDGRSSFEESQKLAQEISRALLDSLDKLDAKSHVGVK